MTREMYDAVIPANIPANAAIVAGYLPPSRYAWTAADWARFPNAVKVRIAVRASTNDGHVLDVENGDATPAQAPGWAHMRRASGYAHPTIYCSKSIQSQVIDAFNQAGEPLPLWWIAHYDNVDALDEPGGSNVVADQYADPGPYDRSIVANFWPGVDGDDMATTDPLPVQRPDGSTPTVGEALGALYLGAFYGGSSTGGTSEYDQLAALTAKLESLATAVAALQAGGGVTQLTGTATVNVDLAPKTA